ncbi:MAG TPA: aspartate carbamoyltransferase, partial [Aquificae bacterium]|nr:aspartate carbamoyltransferase [Aquificota bacterium]
MKKDFLDIKDLTKKDIIEILSRARQLKKLHPIDLDVLKNKNIYFLFFEPSTRTKMSFLQAATLLKGNCFDLELSKSSLTKGESLFETL